MVFYFPDSWSGKMISGLSSLSANARLTGPNWALRPARGSLASRWASPRAALELPTGLRHWNWQRPERLTGRLRPWNWQRPARGSLVPTGPSGPGTGSGPRAALWSQLGPPALELVNWALRPLSSLRPWNWTTGPSGLCPPSLPTRGSLVPTGPSGPRAALWLPAGPRRALPWNWQRPARGSLVPTGPSGPGTPGEETTPETRY